MANNNIIIAKRPEKKDCFEFKNANSIPKELRKNVQPIGEKEFECLCIDGKENTPVKQTGKVGRVIAFEEDTDNITKTGWNCWILGKDYVEERLEKVDGEYFAKPVPTVAAPCTDVLPEFTNGMDIIQEEDGSFSFDPGWGDGTILNAKPGKGVWIYYGENKETGKPDVNFCQFGTNSSANYIVLMEDGSSIPLDDLA